MLREAAFALLREDRVAVEQDVELRLLALDDLRLVRRARVDLGRETRGPAVIAASDGAVENANGRHAARLPVDGDEAEVLFTATATLEA